MLFTRRQTITLWFVKHKSAYSVQDPWSTVQYSIVQYSTVQYSLCQVGYRTLSSIKYWILYHSSSLMPPLEPPHATTPTHTHHHSNPHLPPLQPPPAITPRQQRRRKKVHLQTHSSTFRNVGKHNAAFSQNKNLFKLAEHFATKQNC